MATTTLVQIPYPDEGADPYFDPFEAMVEAIDAAGYATREDKNLLLMGGGYLAWNSTTGVFSWSTPLVMLSAPTGNMWSLPSGSVTLPTDGQLVWVTLSRAPQSTVTLIASVGSSLEYAADPDSKIVIAIRRNGYLVLRNRVVIASGAAASLLPARGSTVLALRASKYSPNTSFATMGGGLLKHTEAAGRKVYLRATMQAYTPSYTIEVQLIDPNNVLGNGAGAQVPGSLLSSSNTIEVEVEAEITALEGLGSDILLVAQAQTVGGHNARNVCNGVGLYLI